MSAGGQIPRHVGKAREKWGEIRPSSLRQAVRGYGSSFIRPSPARTAVYLGICLSLLSVAAVMYRQNFTHVILAQEQFSVPASVSRAVWKQEYRMQEMFRQPGEGGREAAAR